jgi:hypothetical protein
MVSSTCSAVEFLAGGLASSVAEILTLPMDTVKVRMQLGASVGTFDLAYLMLNEEGLGSFFFGIEPAVIRQMCYGSLRYGLYAPIKFGLCLCLLEQGDKATDIPFMIKLLSGMLAGCISSALCNPTGPVISFIVMIGV